ncbi:MAG: CHAD domain-containing protein [Ferrimicrobium sp.]
MGSSAISSMFVSAEVDISEVLSLLSASTPFATVVERTGDRRSELWDTFDWRIHRGGARFELLFDEGSMGGGVSLSSGPFRQSGAVLGYGGEDHLAPRSITPIGLARRTAGLVFDRALVRIASFESVVSEVWLVDQNDKRIGSIEIHTVGELHQHWLVARARRGYDEPLDRLLLQVRAFFSSWVDARQGMDLWDVILWLRGRRPGDYTSRFLVPLLPTTAASVALGELLAYLYWMARRNLSGMVSDVDPEFTHDFRVSLRRARSLIAASEGIVGVERAKALTADLGRTASVCGAVRDLDVAIETSAGIDWLDSPETRSRLDWLRESARRDLIEAVESRLVGESLDRLSNLASFLITSEVESSMPISRAAVDQLRKARVTMRKLATAKGTAQSHEALHKLRKRAKALRYLLEAYSSLLPKASTALAIADLIGLQDQLGRLQDRATLAAILEKLHIDSQDPSIFEIPDGMAQALSRFASSGADKRYESLLVSISVHRGNL